MNSFTIYSDFTYDPNLPNERHWYSFDIPNPDNNMKIQSVNTPSTTPPGTVQYQDSHIVVINMTDTGGQNEPDPISFAVQDPNSAPDLLYTYADVDGVSDKLDDYVQVFVVENGVVKGSESVKYEDAEEDDSGNGGIHPGHH